MAIDETLKEDILLVTEDLESLDASTIELKDLYNEAIPYIVINKLYGSCYYWEPIFINKMLTALATDRLDQFSEEELTVWYLFVNFQDYHSHSADELACNTLAVGCTIPNEEYKSFVVCENGTITETLCIKPRFDVMDAQIWKSLDSAMIALYNCEEINDCGIIDEYEETVPCPI